MAALARDVRQHPDAFQYERAARSGVSQRGSGQALHGLGVTYKKTRSPQGERRRTAFLSRPPEGPRGSRVPIVSIDESGFASDMPRTHGYAPKGKRCFGAHAWGARRRSNVIGALLAGVLLTTVRCGFNIDRDVFHRWIAHQRIPTLPPAALPVMDNAGFSQAL